MAKNENTFIFIIVVVVAVAAILYFKPFGITGAILPEGQYEVNPTCTFATSVSPYTSRYTAYQNSAAWISLDGNGDGVWEKYGYKSSGTTTGGHGTLLIQNFNVNGDDIYINAALLTLRVAPQSSNSEFSSFVLNYGSALNAIIPPCASQPPLNNLINNPGFETSGGWMESYMGGESSIGTAFSSYDTSIKYSGSRSVKLITCGSTCDGDRSIWQDNRPSVTAGTQIKLSGWVRQSGCTSAPNAPCWVDPTYTGNVQISCSDRDGAGPVVEQGPSRSTTWHSRGGARLGIDFRNSAGDIISDCFIIYDWTKPANTWAYIEGVITVPPNAVDGIVWMQGFEYNSPGTVWLDDVSLSSETGCTVSSWTPDTSTVCSGTSFTQTSNCGTTRTATGTKICPICIDECPSADFTECISSTVRHGCNDLDGDGCLEWSLDIACASPYPNCVNGACVASCQCTTGLCCDGCNYKPSGSQPTGTTDEHICTGTFHNLKDYYCSGASNIGYTNTLQVENCATSGKVCSNGACISQTCNTAADIPPCDNKVSNQELLDYINLWVANSATNQQLLDVLTGWVTST